MKCLLVIAFLALSVTAQIEAKYDKFKDQTTVSFSDRYIGTKGGAVRVHVSFIDKDPDTIRFTFRALLGREYRFLRTQGLVILADGERFVSPRGKWATDKEWELLMHTIDRSELVKIAAAKKVELQLGRLEVELSEKQRKELKDLLAYIVK